MRILADVNIEAAIIEWLRTEEHDVTWAAELAPSTTDQQLLDFARYSACVVLTYDKDFGEIVFRRCQFAHGVALLRFSQGTQTEHLNLLQKHWPTIKSSISGSFIVASDNQIRIRALPDL